VPINFNGYVLSLLNFPSALVIKWNDFWQISNASLAIQSPLMLPFYKLLKREKTPSLDPMQFTQRKLSILSWIVSHHSGKSAN